MIEPERRSPEEHSPKATQSRRRLLLIVGGIFVFLSCFCIASLFFLARSASELEAARRAEFDVLNEVCVSGAPIAGTVPYTGLSGTHAIMIIQMDADGGMSRNLITYPRDWQPDTLGQTALVACISPQQEILLESCDYDAEGEADSANYIERYQYQVQATLYEAQNGDPLSDELFYGSVPAPCEDDPLFNGDGQVMARHGRAVDDDDIEAWLREYVVKP